MARGHYAQNTEVSQMRSLEEIERTLKRYLERVSSPTLGMMEKPLLGFTWNGGELSLSYQCHVEKSSAGLTLVGCAKQIRSKPNWKRQAASGGVLSLSSSKQSSKRFNAG